MPEKCSEIRRMGHWKRGIYIKLSEFISNLRQICNNFAHPSFDVQNKIHAILCRIGAQFATNLRNARPLLGDAPFSEFQSCPIYLKPFALCFQRETPENSQGKSCDLSLQNPQGYPPKKLQEFSAEIARYKKASLGKGSFLQRGTK